jgi:hypothetical protein
MTCCKNGTQFLFLQQIQSGTGLGAVQLKRNRPIVAESILKALAIRKQAFSDKNWTTAHTRRGPP